MPTRFDVVILGSGVAGTAAALAAASQGARACVVTGGPGASALFSGAWRGDCPDGLRSALAEVRYTIEPCADALPHPYGHLAACEFTHPSHAAAAPAGGSVVIGIAGLPHFNAAALARRWAAQARVLLNAATVEIIDTPAGGWSGVSLAGLIERQPELLLRPLAPALRAAGAQRAILPPVLGIRHDDATRQTMGAALNATIGEALGVPPSLPGWRLHNALRSCLTTAGVAIFESRGLAGTRTNGRLDQVELMNGDVVAGRSFVLATGKYVAGGIEAEAEFREPALGCPVWAEHLDERFETVDSLLLTDAERSAHQPLLGVGVHTNDESQPVNAASDVVYENVYVAGTVRAGWSVSTHTMGDAASDGWRAGLRATT